MVCSREYYVFFSSSFSFSFGLHELSLSLSLLKSWKGFKDVEFEEIKVSKQIFNEDYIVYLLIKILSLLSIIGVTMDKRNDRKY